jgi:hypothetical protein
MGASAAPQRTGRSPRRMLPRSTSRAGQPVAASRAPLPLDDAPGSPAPVASTIALGTLPT